MAILMRIGDICSIRNGTKKNRNNNIEGNIPVYGSNQNPLYFTNEFNREGATCKISKTKCIPQIMLMNERYFLKDGSFTIESNNQTLLTNEYLWFYLENNSHLIQYIGFASPHINMEHFQNILIPVPSIIQQFEITTNITTLRTIRDQSVQNYDNYINNIIENINV
jgi:type I restriction enzyme S subunit